MADDGSAALMPMRVWPGRPYPLGATWDGMGVNFALFSENATKVELCLFESVNAQSESQRIQRAQNLARSLREIHRPGLALERCALWLSARNGQRRGFGRT
jgi:pullulanase/glycogen debranching enzyme